MDNSGKTYQVRRYRNGYGTGTQIATGLRTLEEAVETVWRLTQLQDEQGGSADYTLLPD
jgi:hypothetical protein